MIFPPTLFVRSTKMVDLIWGAAAVRVAPQPIPPAPNMTSNAVFAQEQALIEVRGVTAAALLRFAVGY